MGELIVARAIFQLGNQFVSGVTYVYSAVFFLLFLNKAVKGELRFSRLEVITFCYFVLSIGISLIDSSVGSVVSQFNKLFLCLTLLKIASTEKLAPEGKAYSAALLSAVFVSIFILASLLLDSSYSYEWGTKTFLMSFNSQHETASLIVLVVSIIGFDLNAIRFRNRLLGCGELVLMTALIYALLMTGARTITLCGVVIYAVCLFKLSHHLDKRIRPILVILVSIVAVLAVVPHLSDTVFFEKNSNLSSSSFSNGREDIWSYYGALFLDQPTINQLFGSGVGLVMERSALSVGTHNDVLTFLLSFGVLGLILYFVFVLHLLWNPEARVFSLLLCLCFLFCAISNGFVGYTELVCAFALVVSMGDMGARRFRVAPHGRGPDRWKF